MKKKWIILTTITIFVIIACGIAAAAAQGRNMTGAETDTRNTESVHTIADPKPGRPVSDEGPEGETTYQTKANGELDIDNMIDENGAIKEEYLDEYYAIVEGWKAWNQWFHSITNPTEETAAPEEPTKYDGTPLSDEEKAQLEEICSREDYGWIVWPMEEAVILGGIDEGFRRMTREEFSKLTEQGLSYEELLQALLERNLYPDMCGGPMMNIQPPPYLFILEGGETVYFSQSFEWTLYPGEKTGDAE